MSIQQGISTLTKWDVRPEVQAFYDECLVWEMVLPIHDCCGNSFALSDRFRAAGYDFISYTIAGDDTNLSEAIQRIADVRTKILANPQKYVLVESSEDILTAKAAGKLAISFHFEGTRALERRLDMIEVYYKLGVRHNQIAFNLANSAGCGCLEDVDSGLTRYGKAVVREMNRVGMVVDLSHTGYQTTMDIMETSDSPVIVSHSNAKAIHPHYRNLSDDQFQRCAEMDGVIGVSGASEYLGSDPADNEAIFRHIDHISCLVGPERVGLGLDLVAGPEVLMAYMKSRQSEWFTEPDRPWSPPTFAQPEQVAALAQLMLDRGYSNENVKGILGENFLRVMRAVWK